MNLYAIKAAGGSEYKVVLVRTGKPYFYGTRKECREWIELNGHDENN
jgi:hypothetical protein